MSREACVRSALACVVLLPLLGCAGAGTAPVTTAGVAPPGSAAPDRLGPVRYLPADYEGELFTDYAALRACGLLDQLERLPTMTGFLDSIAAGFFCDLDDLQRVRTAIVWDQPSAGRSTVRTVSVAEGASFRRPASLPKSWVPVQVGPFDAVQLERGPSSRPTVFWPQDGIVVSGGHDLVGPICEDTSRHGRPHPDLLPLLLGKGVLFQWTIGCFGQPIWTRTFTVGFPGSWVDDGDPVEFARVRLEHDEGRGLVLSVLLRYRHGTTGPELVRRHLQGHIDDLLADKQMAVFHDLLRAVELVRTGRDLTAQLALGSTRRAMATIQNAMLGLMKLRQG